MSLDTCKSCGAHVDTDEETDFYYSGFGHCKACIESPSKWSPEFIKKVCDQIRENNKILKEKA